MASLCCEYSETVEDPVMLFRRREPGPMDREIPMDRVPTVHDRSGEICHVSMVHNGEEKARFGGCYAPLQGRERSKEACIARKGEGWAMR
jgi:hypothetical protein